MSSFFIYIEKERMFSLEKQTSNSILNTNSNVKGNKKNIKKFLTFEEKNEIQKMVKCGQYPTEISKKLNISYRKVRSYIKEIVNAQTNTFTEEDDKLIIHLYKNGVTKESMIAKQMPSKAPWMIRNRIKKLIKKNIIQKSTNNTCNSPVNEVSVDPDNGMIATSETFSYDVSDNSVTVENENFDIFSSFYDEEQTTDYDYSLNVDEYNF